LGQQHELTSANAKEIKMPIKPIKTPVGVTEASGVTRKGNDLLIVSDAAPGAYYSFDVSGERGPLIHLPPDKVVRHELGGGTPLAIDFESLDVLADGRVVALSERLRSLIGESGLVLQYDDPLSEIGERGLEGLTIRPGSDGISEVAVLWEGGWIQDEDVNRQVRQRLRDPLSPIVLMHEFKPGETYMKLTLDKDQHELVELKVAQPDRYEQRLESRAPDLVWHQWHDESGQTDQGFIVILNSWIPSEENFGPRWLQRFDRRGNQVGSPLDLDEEAKKLLGHDRLKGANWEGLGWYEAGKRLVLVHDAPNLSDDTPVALVVDLPSSWS
jgi:hypothetical protein